MLDQMNNLCLYGSVYTRNERCTPAAAKKFIEVPYDLYCPTVDLKSRICSICSLYLPSNAAVPQHKIECQGIQEKQQNETSEDPLDTEDVEDVHHVDTLPDAAYTP